MGTFGTLLCCLALVVVGADPTTLGRPDRSTVLEHARGVLRSNGNRGLQSRVPRRASPQSTFSQFLRGTRSGGIRPIEGHCDTPAADPGSIDPVEFGADPTGVKDSSDAFDQAIAELLKRNTSGRTAGSGTVDLGGAHINLKGGDFLISRPIVFPHGYAHFGIGHGAIRASPSFPRASARYLIEVSDVSVNECKVLDPQQKSCNEDVDIVDLLLDGSRVAYGGLSINATMGSNVGPDIFVINFVNAGISVNGGHEVMIHEAWLGALYYSAKNKTWLEAGSTAIELFGNDHVISDVIIFGGQIGVHNIGGANLLEGIHTWNDATHAPSPGIGILLTNSQSVRCLAVYLDFTALRIEGPTHISVADSFFLGGGTVVLAPRTDGQPAAAQIEGLVLTDNTFENYKSGPNVTVVVDERNLSFSRPVDMVMKGNIGTTTMVPRSVTATKTLQLSGHLATFNFSDTFVFPKLGIVDASLSVISPSGFVQFALRPPVGQSITVEASEATTASVSVTATQGAFTVGNGRFG